MHSLRDLIFTPEVVSQREQLFHNDQQVDNFHSQQENLESSLLDTRFRTVVNENDRSINVTATVLRPRRLRLYDENDTDENSDEETTNHRPPRKRQERKTADPVDKTIPRLEYHFVYYKLRFVHCLPCNNVYRAIAGQLPATSENPSTLYLHAPQNSDRLQYNGKPLCYPENYTAYLKFPQDYNFLPNQRNIVREMWNRCFYGKDYAGALTVRIITCLRYYFVLFLLLYL